MANFELSNPVKYTNKILGFYTEGPWTSVFDANANIYPAIRVQGMACKIIIAGVAHIYWYRDGVADGDLIEFTSGSGFDPENILTNLLFGSTSSPRKLERFYDTGTGFQYTGGVSFEDSYTVLEHKRVEAGITRLAQLILAAQSSLALVYDSPTGYNRLELTDSLTQILKVARYFSAPTLSNDLDIPHKKYIDDNFLLASAYNDRYKGRYTTLVALQTAHPTSTQGSYAQLDTGAGNPVVNYNWDVEDGWVIGSSGSSATDTDMLPEGATNLYFTNARAIAALSSTLANYILTSAISNVLTVTAAGLVMDARQGKVLKDLIDALTSTVGGKVDKLTGQATRIGVWDVNGDLKGYSSLTYDTALQIINSSPELLLNRSGSLFRLYKDSFGLKASNNVLQAAGLGSAIKLTATQLSKITPSYPALSTSFAVSFWVKHTAATRVSVFSFVDGTKDFAFVERNLGTIQYYQLNGGADSATFPIGTLKNGNWHHVVLSCATSIISVYIDGILTSTKSTSGPARTNLNIGYSAMQYANYYSDSWIDDFRVYNSVLSAEDVLNIYGQLPPVGKLPVLHFKFDENSGNILTDSKDGVLSPVNYTINGVVGWGVGIANAAGASAIAQIIESKDGSYNGERGIHRFGDILGKFVATGNQFYVEINETIYPVQIDATGRITLDASNGDSTLGKGPITNNSLPTAKVNIGAPTTTLAGLRLFAGTENTSTQNVGDVNHSTVRRTFIKRKGTTGNTVPLADVDTLFTGGYAQIDDPTTTGSLLAINATYGGGNIIPANFLCLSKTIELDLDGTIVAGSAGNAVIAVKLGAVTIASFSVATADAVTASPFFLKVKIQDINVAGEVMVTGRLELNAATYKMIGSNGGQASGVDKTTALTLDVTGTLTGTTTGGSIRCLISTAKILN